MEIKGVVRVLLMPGEPLLKAAHGGEVPVAGDKHLCLILDDCVVRDTEEFKPGQMVTLHVNGTDAGRVATDERM